MKLRLITFLMAASAGLAACSGGSSSGTPGGPVQPGPPPVPMALELAAFARAGMVEPEDAAPRVLNDVDLVSSEDNPSEFDDWFQ
jgi:hypothetical protein